MSTYYCKPDIVSLQQLADFGFAVAGTVISSDLSQHQITLSVSAMWGATLPLRAPGDTALIAQDQAHTFNIQKIDWCLMGKRPIRFLRHSVRFSTVQIGQPVILATNVLRIFDVIPSQWDDDNTAAEASPPGKTTALTSPYALTYEILPADDAQRHRLDLFFHEGALAHWQANATTVQLVAALADPELNNFSITALHKRKLINSNTLATIDNANLRFVLDFVEHQFTADEITTLLHDMGQFCHSHTDEAFPDSIFDWLKHAMIYKHIQIAQALYFIRPLSIDNSFHHKRIGYFINFIFTSFKENIHTEWENIYAEITVLFVQYLTHSDRHAPFDIADFKYFFKTLARPQQHALLLQLCPLIHTNQRACDSGYRTDVDLMFFILDMAILDPFIDILPELRKLRLGFMADTLNKIECRMKLMNLGLQLMAAFPHTQQEVTSIILPWIGDESVFHPPVFIFIVDGEDSNQMRARWDDTLARFKQVAGIASPA